MADQLNMEDLYRMPPREALAPENGSQTLRVGIIGAGIGGLTAAIALLESGHEVEIFEKSRFKGEVGAAVTTPPNSSRVLAYYGFDFERAQATATENTILYNDLANLEQKTVLPAGDFESKYGAPWLIFHRVDLHDELRRLATEPTASRPRAAYLHLGTSVSSIDLDGTIHFEDGTNIQKDLVIAADGIRSSFLSTVTDEDIPAEHWMSMVRLMVPTEDLAKDPETVAIFKDGHSSLRRFAGHDRSIIMYGCRRGALQNIGIVYNPKLAVDSSGNDVSGKEDFVDQLLQGWPQALRTLCTGANGIGNWKVYTRRPLERLARGRVVLIGDAAHPMPPMRAQGASMAIEDAAALGVLFSNISSETEIPGRLETFNKLRVNRVAATQIMSSQHNWSPTGIPKECARYFDGAIPRDMEEMERHSCANNVIRDAFNMVHARDQSSNMPRAQFTAAALTTDAHL